MHEMVQKTLLTLMAALAPLLDIAINILYIANGVRRERI